jgi:hypothetical protein
MRLSWMRVALLACSPGLKCSLSFLVDAAVRTTGVAAALDEQVESRRLVSRYVLVVAFGCLAFRVCRCVS